MSNELKKAAEILVECGYARCIPSAFNFIPHEDVVYIQMVEKPDPFQSGQYSEVKPFADTLEGRRQADAIEDYLRDISARLHEPYLWRTSQRYVAAAHDFTSNYQDRIERIKWCLEQLTGEDNEQTTNS